MLSGAFLWMGLQVKSGRFTGLAAVYSQRLFFPIAASMVAFCFYRRRGFIVWNCDGGLHRRGAWPKTLAQVRIFCRYLPRARVAELVDAAGLGPAAARCGGSSPSTRTIGS